MRIAVWVSCGAPSAVAAKMTADQYRWSNAEIFLCNHFVKEEGPDNQRFLREVAEWVDLPITDIPVPKFPNRSAEEVWDHEKAMVFPTGAPCTRILKRKAGNDWEVKNHIDWHVFGFTLEEKRRSDRFMLTEKPNVLPILIDAGITRDDCFRIIREAGIELPEAYRLGYPNANCRGCVKATSPTYWNHVRAVDPDVFARRVEQSRRLGVRLARVKGRRVFLDELSPEARGRPMKSLPAVDCSAFCEEWPK